MCSMRRRTYPSAYALAPISPLIRLWMLRILVPLGGHHAFFNANGFANDALARAVGLGNWIDAEDEPFSTKSALHALRKLHAQAEQECRETEVSPALSANIVRLAELVGLSEVDCRILEFTVTIHSDRLLDDAADYLGMLTSSKLVYPLAGILAIPEAEIRAALGSKGLLARSALLSVDYSCVTTIKSKLNLLSDQFAEYISTADTDPVSLLRDSVCPSQAGQLSLADYPHVREELALLRPYLHAAVQTRRHGVNIFLYGPPGTGKTELARAVAAELGVELFEIASMNSEGDPLHGGNRLRAYKAAQSFFASRKSLLLFDEVEDVFNDGEGFLGKKSTGQVRKAWINRMLEENPVPTLWISNSVSCMDPAFIRRFDMVIELPVPPKQQRVRFLQQACPDLLDTASAERLAQCESLAPAVVARASQVVHTALGRIGAGAGSAAVELLINNTLAAQGHMRVRKDDPNRLPGTYDPAFIHANVDLVAVAAGLRHAKAGRMCLYGPPGTGKSAYARWLADQLEAPLHVQRASDLLSKWVGENEKNIANAFHTAQEAGAVLLIDEVDGFLRDRRGTDRGWEASLVNEMLTQMEGFAGVFIASTNLMDDLDQAALRRFDIKVKFDFLSAGQAWRLLQVTCDALGMVAPEPSLQPALMSLPNLTPGDFAAITRQHRFHPFADAEGLVSALASESALKRKNKAQPIGFL